MKTETTAFIDKNIADLVATTKERALTNSESGLALGLLNIASCEDPACALKPDVQVLLKHILTTPPTDMMPEPDPTASRLMGAWNAIFGALVKDRPINDVEKGYLGCLIMLRVISDPAGCKEPKFLELVQWAAENPPVDMRPSETKIRVH